MKLVPSHSIVGVAGSALPLAGVILLLAGCPASSEPLEQRLSRTQIHSTLRRAEPRVSRCFEGQATVVEVSLEIQGSTGQVTGVSIAGGALTPSARSCVEQAVRRVRFPRFNQSSMTVRSFPFRVR